MSCPAALASRMLAELEKQGCLYQQDVVDYLVKSGQESFLRENVHGNLVLAKSVIDAFISITEHTVVWVKPDLYWRYRVPEDEPGREARG